MGPKDSVPTIGGYYSLSQADTQDISNRAAFNLAQALNQIESGVKAEDKNKAINQLGKALKFAKFQIEFNQLFLDSTRLPKGHVDQERALLNTVLEDLEKNSNIPKSDVETWKNQSQETHKDIQVIFNAIHLKIEAIAKNKYSTAVYDLARNNSDITYTQRESSAAPKKFMMDALDPLKKLKERISAQVQPKSNSKAQKN